MSITNLLAYKNKDDIAIEQGIADMNRKADKRRNRMCIGDKAIVVLRFDDGKSTDYTKVFPILKANKLVGSFAVVPRYIGGEGYMTEAQINELVDYGMEIMSHTYTHGQNGPTNASEENHEIIDSKTFLNAKGWRTDGFQIPGSWSGNNTLNNDLLWNTTRLGRLIRSQYIVAGSASQSMNGLYPIANRYGLEYISLAAPTVEGLQRGIDNAINRKGILALLYHSQQLDTGTFLTTAQFTEVMEYIKTKRDAGLLEVLTHTGAVFATQSGGIWEDIVYDGSFEFGMGWYTSGTPVLMTDGGHTGDNYVKVKASNAYIQNISGLQATDIPGSQLLFRGWHKKDVDAVNGPRLSIFFDNVLKFSETSSLSADWALKERAFTVPLTTNAVKIGLDTDGGTYGFWDDIQLLRL